MTLICALLTLACGNDATAPTTPASTTATKLTVSVSYQSAPVIILGSTVQLSAIATMSDGTLMNVTAAASWQSSAATIAKVSATGLVTAGDAGTATITATYQSLSVSIAQVISPRPVSITSAWCGQARAGTYDTLACIVVVQGASNPTSTGYFVSADLRAFGLSAQFRFSRCPACGQEEWDLDFHIPPGMAPGVVPIAITFADAQGRMATTTAYFTVLPG
jgi:hypothetical protein